MIKERFRHPPPRRLGYRQIINCTCCQKPGGGPVFGKPFNDIYAKLLHFNPERGRYGDGDNPQNTVAID